MSRRNYAVPETSQQHLSEHKFSMETEDDSSLPVLNVMVQRNPKSLLGLAVHRKLMHTDLYLHASSHHNPLQKSMPFSQHSFIRQILYMTWKF
jgi:hypothetical protein